MHIFDKNIIFLVPCHKRWHKCSKSNSNCRQWTNQQMLAAIEAVENGCGVNQAAKEHGVPKSQTIRQGSSWNPALI